MEEGNDEEDEAGDYSDMPKLLPITHMDHDELLEAEQNGENVALEERQRKQQQKERERVNGDGEHMAWRVNAVPPVAMTTAPPTSSTLLRPNMTTLSAAAATMVPTTTAEMLFHQGMSLQELAECISSSIPPEKVSRRRKVNARLAK